MMCMFEWILSNLKLIVSGILVIISVIVFILRKPNKYELIDTGAFRRICDLISEAEIRFGAGHGEEKLQYVINHYNDEKGLENCWIPYIVSIVEYILSLPSKK